LNEGVHRQQPLQCVEDVEEEHDLVV